MDAVHLLQEAPFAYIMLDERMTIVYANEKFFEWTNASKDEVLHKKTLIDFISPGDKIFLETHILPKLHIQKSVSEVYTSLISKQNRKTPVLLNFKLHETQQSDIVYLIAAARIQIRKVLEDEWITAKSNAEENLNKLMRLNAHLEKFIQSTIHDLKAPLNNIIGLLDLVETSELHKIDSEISTFLNLMKKSSSSLKSLIDQLLINSNYNLLIKPRKIYLSDLINEVIDLFQYQIKKLEAVLHIDVSSIYINADKLQMMRVFQNIIDNALKYRDPKRTPEISIKGFYDDDSICIIITDNGRGINQNELPGIFKFRKQISDDINSQGIGLYNCARIIESHGGMIECFSKEGEGTTFKIQLPHSFQ